jgi:hypothetical protein
LFQPTTLVEFLDLGSIRRSGRTPRRAAVHSRWISGDPAAGGRTGRDGMFAR